MAIPNKIINAHVLSSSNATVRDSPQRYTCKNVKSFYTKLFINKINRGAWVTQLFECPTPDLGSGHDPRIVKSSPWLDAMLSMELA